MQVEHSHMAHMMTFTAFPGFGQHLPDPIPAPIGILQVKSPLAKSGSRTTLTMQAIAVLVARVELVWASALERNKEQYTQSHYYP